MTKAYDVTTSVGHLGVDETPVECKVGRMTEKVESSSRRSGSRVLPTDSAQASQQSDKTYSLSYSNR